MILQNVVLQTNKVPLFKIQTKFIHYIATTNSLLAVGFTKTNRSIKHFNYVKVLHTKYSFIKPVNMRHQSTSREVPNDKKSKNDKVPLTEAQKLEKAFAEYSSITVVRVVMYGGHILSLISFYTLVTICLNTSGLDTSLISTALGLNNWIYYVIALAAAKFTVAHIVHSVFYPVRINITVACIQFIVRHLRRVLK